MVPTEWNRRTMLKAGMTLPIGVVPHVASCLPDAEPSANPHDALARLSSEDFVFYSIGDWSERKGMHLTLDAYLRAFSRHDPVVPFSRQALSMSASGGADAGGGTLAGTSLQPERP
jgi:hypothetical protein